MKSSSPKSVIFFQHSNHNGGSPRSLHQIVLSFEEEFGPQTVLFIRKGNVLSTYADLSSDVICGSILLPFHGSEVTGMNWKLAVRNVVGLLFVPGGYFRYLRGHDVVYLNSSSLCFFGILVSFFSPNTKVIYHLREPLLRSIWGRVIREVVRRSADYVIAISQNELDNLALPEIPGEVVMNYVDSSKYVVRGGYSLHRCDPNVGKDPFVVGYFARIDSVNGIEDFIALANMFEQVQNVVFCIYGFTGREKKELRDLVCSSESNVFVYPMVSDVPVNLVDIDVLVVPFRSPHFSRSVIEGAMLRVPSIIYDVDSVNETVIDGKTGYVVPVGDVRKMADIISLLMSDSDLRDRLGEEARAFALEKFSERNYQRIRNAIVS